MLGAAGVIYGNPLHPMPAIGQVAQVTLTPAITQYFVDSRLAQTASCAHGSRPYLARKSSRSFSHMEREASLKLALRSGSLASETHSS